MNGSIDNRVNQQTMRRSMGAFTLIELSIVLVIIGLITGGVLAGNDLIKSAAARAQISQIEKYNTAVNTFFGKYGYLPGDITASAAQQFGFVPRPGTTGLGDGNGLLNGYNMNAQQPYDTAQWGEPMLFWVDLSKAGLIDGTFNTASAYGGGANVEDGNTLSLYLPTAKLGGGNIVLVYDMNNANYFGVQGVTLVSGGGIRSTGDVNGATPMTVQQAYQIDKKVDDGLPMTGRVVGSYLNYNTTHGYNSTFAIGDNTFSNPVDSPTTCYNNGSNQYSLNINGGTGANCSLGFKMQGGD